MRTESVASFSDALVGWYPHARKEVEIEDSINLSEQRIGWIRAQNTGR